MTKERYNELSKEIVDACYQVHKELGLVFLSLRMGLHPGRI